jgi:peptidoglycan hydrolase CwlO-like protein
MDTASDNKAKKLDLFIIILGAAALITAILFGFVLKSNPMGETISNIAFAVGFLAYIAYSYLRSAAYEKMKFQQEQTIEERNNEIQNLNAELEKSKKEISSLKSEVSKMQSELKKSKEEVSALKADLAQAEQQIAALSKEDK